MLGTQLNEKITCDVTLGMSSHSAVSEKVSCECEDA